MLARFLRRILFNLVHLVLSVIIGLNNLYRQFWTNQCYVSKNTVPKKDIAMILHIVPKLHKKLHHLVMITHTDNHTLGDLALIVIWSLLAGVPYVSFYDITGKLTGQQEELFLEVEKRKIGIPGCIKWSKMPNLNGYSNGSQVHTVVVNIFDSSHGRPKIVQCIKEFAKSKSSSREITAQEFDQSLSQCYPSIPEPDLALYTGPLCCTHGLLPWQIRLTEFLQLSLDSSIVVQDYLNALSKYNKCDQRFGK